MAFFSKKSGVQPEQPGHLVRGDDGGEKPGKMQIEKKIKKQKSRDDVFCTSDPPICAGPD